MGTGMLETMLQEYFAEVATGLGASTAATIYALRNSIKKRIPVARKKHEVLENLYNKEKAKNNESTELNLQLMSRVLELEKQMKTQRKGTS